MMRRQWQHARRILVWSILLLPTICIILQAQAPPPALPAPAPPPEKQTSDYPAAPPCTDCYKGFRFDSTFRIGAHFNGSWAGAAQIATDSLHIEITQLYNERSSLRRFLDSTQWQMVTADSASNYFDWRWQARGRWADSLKRRFWRDIRAADLKVIIGPGWIPVISKSAELSEAYFGQAGKDNYDIDGWDSPLNDTIHRIEFMEFGAADSMDREQDKFIWGGKFLKRENDTVPSLIVSGHQYTQMAFTDPDSSLYQHVGHVADAGIYDVSVAIKVTQDSVFNNVLGPNSVVAYVNVYRRIPVGQDSCGCNLYEIVDSLTITKARYLDSAASDTVGSGYRDIIFPLRFPDSTFFSASRLQIERKPGELITALDSGATYPRYTSRGGFKAWFDNRMAQGDEDDTVGYGRYCKRLRDSLIARGYYSADRVIDRTKLVNYSDISYDVYTTRKVDVTFLRGRIAPHTYRLLRSGVFNATILADIDSVRADTTYQHQLFRVGVVDEHSLEKYRGYMDVASRVQRSMLLRDSNDTRGLWANPQADAASFRVLTGDLDTTQIRMVHMAANQIYNFGGRIPVAYANPDSMVYREPGPDSGTISSALVSGLYRAMPVVPAPDRWTKDRMIAFNAPKEYKVYTDTTIHSIDLRRDQLVAMINTSRFMFRHIRRESYPIYSVVQVHGFLGAIRDVGYTNTWDGFRPITPEEITVQSWLVLNTGCDGMWFSDFCYDAAYEFGVVHWLTGDHSSNYQNGLSPKDPYTTSPEGWKLPLIWTGFKDRYDAVKRVTDEFHDVILPVYQKLDRNGIRMAVYRDTNFYAMPMIDTIYTQRAARDKDGAGEYQPLVENIGGVPTILCDSLRGTYLEATVFSPGPSDTNRRSRYLLLTNLRCWPVDYHTYGRLPDSLYKLNEPSDSNRYEGFGAIDARRLVVILKNTTGIIADAAYIQRIGDTAIRTVEFGEPVELDWLDPGWGAMYRITPIVKPISALGTAYNNAVHSLNPSVDGAAHDRLFVYERDSAVYLRTLDSTGRWGAEHMISLPSDTVTVLVEGTKRNTADNMFPAIDMIRNGGSSCAIVWERHDTQTDSVTVEMAWLPSRPTRNTFPSGGIVRRRLSRPREFSHAWMQLTPAITGVDSGYVVAWASPDYTTEVIAVRDNPVHGRLDTSRTLRVKLIQTSGGMPSPTQPDSATATPSLAYVRNWGPTVMNGGILTGPDDDTAFITMPPIAEGVSDTIKAFHIAHLAYAQGKRGSPHNFSVMYNRIGATFPRLSDSLIPRLWASATEDASINISGCDRVYPSIAADSARIAVTFTSQAAPDYVYLRFKDAASTGLLSWNTPAYVWGGGKGMNARDYERSSVTMFPDRLESSLESSYEGALTWQWTNPAGGRHNGVKFYRFGRFTADSVPDGQHPSMTLVSGIGDNATNAMKGSGIFRRGADAEEFEQFRQRGDTGVYYPGYFDNTPASPIEILSSPPPTTTIHAEGEIRKKSLFYFSDCPTTSGGSKVGLLWSVRTDLPDSGIPPGPPPQPNGSLSSLGMPPAFFPRSLGLNDAATTASDLGNITRTPSFTVDTTTITVTRTVSGDDSLMAWLNSEPNDPITGLPANIYYSVQVVRDSDNVVLWTGDTVSARGVAADTVEEEITVPVQSVASAGTAVHVRLAAITSYNLDYSVASRFQFNEQGSGAPAKRVIRSTNSTASASASESIGVRMIPNPMHSASGELRITAPAAGTAAISIYDLLGNRVMVLPAIDVKRAGEYAVPVDLAGLRDGVYVVDVRSGTGRGTTRITLVR